MNTWYGVEVPRDFECRGFDETRNGRLTPLPDILKRHSPQISRSEGSPHWIGFQNAGSEFLADCRCEPMLTPHLSAPVGRPHCGREPHFRIARTTSLAALMK